MTDASNNSTGSTGATSAVALPSSSIGTLSSGGRAVLYLACCVAVIAGMQAAKAILVPFLLAVFIAIVCGPILFLLQRMRVGPTVSLIIVIGGLVLGTLGLVALVGTSIADFTANIDVYGVKLEEQEQAFFDWVERLGINVEAYREQRLFDAETGLALLQQLLSSLGSAMSDAFLIAIIVIFILLEASSFPIKILAMSKPGSRAEFGSHRIVSDIRRYMATKTVISIVTGVLVTVGLLILRIDYAVLWGLLAFLFNYVPNIGSIIAAAPAVLLALVGHGLGTAIITAGIYLSINVVIGYFVEPRLMGRRMGLSTLVVFLSLVFWGWVLGPVGMLLSVPLTMAVRIMLESSPETRWIALLLASEAESRQVLTSRTPTAVTSSTS